MAQGMVGRRNVVSVRREGSGPVCRLGMLLTRCPSNKTALGSAGIWAKQDSATSWKGSVPKG